MRIAFFCSTPYQILLAINIKHSNHLEEKADIYVLNHFNDAHNIVRNIKGVGVFENIKLVDCIEFTRSFSINRIKRYVQKTILYLKPHKISNQYFGFGDLVYSQIYLTYPDVVIQLAMKDLYERNPELKIHMYEDGTGGYSSDILKTTKYKEWFNKITGFGEVIDRYDSLMMFKPELYFGNVDIPKVRIPHIDKTNEELKNIINKVFEYQDDYRIDEKIIFLEQPMNHVPGLSEQIRCIADEILKDNYVIKLHPRSRSEDYKDHNIYKKNSSPWEILCLNNSTEDKVLISYHSTALISNKIIFNNEPVIIFLYEMEELIGFHQVTQGTKEFIYRFKSTYRDPSRVLIPRNKDELKRCLAEFTRK